MSKVNKSEVIRKLYDDGHGQQEIHTMTKYSKPLINIVVRNLEKKREQYNKKEKKSKIVKAMEEMEQMLSVIGKKSDLVNNPPHYKTGGIDFLDYAEAKGLTENAYLFNVVKYVSRAGKKVGADPVQDLEKAEFYLKREIERRKSA
jgi:hypothetical protein